MRSTSVTPSTTAAAAHIATTNAPELPPIATEPTPSNEPPLVPVEQPQQLVIKSSELKAIADIYIEIAKRYKLDETYNVLKHFTGNAWSDKNFIKRTFFYDRGKMNVCYPPDKSKFKDTIEGFLDTVTKHRTWKAEVKSSMQFAFDCVKYTLYFIEKHTANDPVRQLHQYKCAFQICSHLRSAAYSSIPSLTETTVQTRFGDIQNIIREEIGKLLTTIERHKIQIATQNITDDADAILNHLLVMVLQTLFDTPPPKDLLIQRHLNIFKDPHIRTMSEFNKSGADRTTLAFVRNDEILAFMRYLCNTNESSLRKARDRITFVSEEILRIEQDEPPFSTLSTPDNESESVHAIQQVFNRDEIIQLREAYNLSQKERITSAEKFAKSQKLSAALNEINSQQTPSLPYTAWITEALVLIGDWIKAKSTIAEVNEIVQGTATLAPLVCGDSNILNNTYQELQSLLGRTNEVIGNFSHMANKVRLKSTSLQKNAAWNGNITSAERDHIVPISTLIGDTTQHLANFSASIEPEYVSLSLTHIKKSILKVYATQFLAGKAVSLPSFVKAATLASKQLDKQARKEKAIRQGQEIERRKVFGQLTGPSPAFTPGREIENSAHSTVSIEEIENDEPAPIAIQSQSHSLPNAREPNNQLGITTPKDFSQEKISKLQEKIETMKTSILKKQSELTHLDHSNDFVFKIFKPKPWWAPLWLTGIGLIVHLFLMAGAVLYRLTKRKSIKKDKQTAENLKTEISQLNLDILKTNNQIAMLQNNRASQPAIPPITSLDPVNTTSQVMRTLQANPTPQCDNTPISEAESSKKNLPVIIAPSDTQEMATYANLWLKKVEQLVPPELFTKIQTQFTKDEIHRECFCDVAFNLLEEELEKELPLEMRKAIVFHAFRQILEKREQDNPKNKIIKTLGFDRS